MSPSFFRAFDSAELVSGRMHMGIKHDFSSGFLEFSKVTQTSLKYSYPILAKCAATTDISHPYAARIRISSGVHSTSLVPFRALGARCPLFKFCLPCRKLEK